MDRLDGVALFSSAYCDVFSRDSCREGSYKLVLREGVSVVWHPVFIEEGYESSIIGYGRWVDTDGKRGFDCLSVLYLPSSVSSNHMSMG